VHLRERLAPDIQTLTGLELAIRRESLRMAQLAGRLIKPVLRVRQSTGHPE